MELEFDKEIDAILRKARHTSGAPAASPHLDADVIAAFAENAIPQGARPQYTLHLAECDRCRTYLSETLSAGEEAAEMAAAIPAAALSEADASVPWYEAFFRKPNLAAAMGALILVFTGVLGFLVIRNDRNEQNAIVTQVSEPEIRPGGPFVDDQTATANANASMPDTAGGAAIASADTSAAGRTANFASNTSISPGPDLRKDPAGEKLAAADDKALTLDGVTASRRNMAAPPPPPPAAAGSLETVVTDQDEAKKEDAERRQAELSDASLALKVLKRKEADEVRSPALPPAAAKSSPARSGPVQMQSNQMAENARQMTVMRSAGGRKFTNRDGAWYDTAYRGQPTTNIRRGTDDFKKLDSGLRRIADQIDGVVVIMWKSRAYRIQ